MIRALEVGSLPIYTQKLEDSSVLHHTRELDVSNMIRQLN